MKYLGKYSDPVYKEDVLYRKDRYHFSCNRHEYEMLCEDLHRCGVEYVCSGLSVPVQDGVELDITKFDLDRYQVTVDSFKCCG